MVIDEILPNYITLKDVLMLTTCVIKENDKYYLQIFLK